MSLFTFLKVIHVLSAIAAFGANITYILWITRARSKPEALTFTLRTVKMLDDWIATPAYILLLPSGLWLASLAGWRLTTPWILTTFFLYALLSVAGLGVYTPTLKKQIAIAENLGPNAAEYQQISMRLNILGIALNLLVLAIVFLMVAKPTLWG